MVSTIFLLVRGCAVHGDLLRGSMISMALLDGMGCSTFTELGEEEIASVSHASSGRTAEHLAGVSSMMLLH